MAVGTTAFPTSLDTVVELVELKNNASSTLSGNVLIGDVTIGVTDISEFPTTGYGTLTDDLTTPTKTEIISWTGISGSNLTGCTRGTQGTSAAAFSSGNYLEVRPTAGHHEALRGAVIAIETKLGTGSTIAVNKLAALTASRAVVTDASGFLASATVTAAELGYLAGVTTPTGSGALVLATSPTLSAPSIAKLANLTSNGFVKTGGGDGTLSVDTSTYLTANQTITLSSDVTGSGTTGITTTIASGAVTYAKMQNISATQRVLGRNTAGAGSTEEVTITQFLDWAGTAAQGDILYRGASAWALLPAGTNGHYLKTQGAAANPVWAAVVSGSGDVVGPGSATDNAVVRFDSTTGKLVQDSVVTIADTTGNMAGVGTLNGHTIPGGTDTFVLLTANQTLTTKTLTSPDINGGTADSLTSLSVRSTGAAFDLLFANTEVLTGNKTLTIKVNDTSRTVDLAGNLTIAANFTTSGANALTLTTTGATNVTLPTTGTLVNSAVTSLSSLTTVGTITTGGLGTGAVLGGVTMTLGSDADGDIYYRSSNVLTRLAKGTALQQLRMNAGATAPEWATIAGGGITVGTTTITSGTAGRILYETSGNVVGEIAGSSVDANGAVQFAATARTSGVAQYYRINTPADTGQTASTESVGVYFGGNGSGSTVTRTWANGNITTQREHVFVAPTYAFVSGSNTITSAITLAITGEPAAGSFATITNPIALYVGGRTGINTTAPAAQTHIVSASASRVALRVDSAATPSVDAFQVSADNGTTTHFKVTSTGAPSAPIPGHSGSERFGAVTAYATTSTAAGAVLMGVAHNINVTGTLLNSVVMGRAVTMSGSSVANASVIIGSGTGITLTANRLLNDAVVIGQWTLQSQNYHGGSVYIGSGSTGGGTDSQSSVAIGTAMNYPQGSYGISIGAGAQGGIGDNTGYYVALGGFANANYGKSVAIGAYATTTAAAQFVSGSSSYPMNNVFFGKGATNATPTAYAINGTGGSGADVAGGAVNIAGGLGTGTGIPGTIGMQFARAAAGTASTLNTISDEWRASYSTTDTVTLAANIKTSTTALTAATAINSLWTTATHASRTSAITLSTVDNAASLAERWRLSTNGAGTGVSTTITGFFGGTNVTGMLAESITLNTGGTTTDSTIDLPANSIILSVTGRITTTITTATDWKLGDATIADRFSDANATLTANTTTVGINQWKADRTTAGQGAFQQSTAKVRITTTGTPGAGVIRITIHYITLTAPTS